MNKATTCVIIGYSFRDQDIVDNIIDALNRNPYLWLVIISPNASKYKNKYFTQNLELASRVVVISKKIEDVVTNRRLDEYRVPLILLKVVRNPCGKGNLWNTTVLIT